MPAPDMRARESPADDLLWRHLKSVPAFRALLRAVEARYYHHLHIPEPVLDLGCGDGHFADMAFDRMLTAGVDPWWGPLRKAHGTGVYRLNVQALGDALPFADATFASVISNSVLEHIPNIQPVLDEAYRVLRADGRLIITMPSHLFTAELGGAQVLRPFGLANAYRRFFNRISRHAHTDSPRVWASRLAHAGFAVERWQYYFSKDALRALELGHVQGLPSAILHFLTGHWILAPWRESLAPTERWLRPYYEEEPPKEGAYLIMVARKSPAVTRDDGNIEVRLPIPHPLPTREPAAMDSTSPDRAPSLVRPDDGRQTQPDDGRQTQPDDGRQTDSFFTLNPSLEEVSNAGEEPIAGSAGGALAALLLLLTGLFAAFTGQSILSQRLPSSLIGLWWYAFALIAFASSALLLRQLGRSREDVVRFSRRHLLYPLAVILSLLAQEQSGGNLSGGSPLLAVALWLVGIACAVVSASPPAAGQKPTDNPAPDEESESQPGNQLAAALGRRLRRATALQVAALFALALIPRIVILAEHPFILNGVEASLGLDALGVLAGQIRNPFATAWLTNPTLPLFPLAPIVALVGRSALGLRLLSALVGAFTVPLLFLIARRLWNQRMALAASLLLAGYHLHVHYSRLGMSNIWDPFMALLVFGLMAVALEQPNRRHWLWAGLATGLSAYFYTPSHLLPFYLGAIAIYLGLVRRDIVTEHWTHILAAGAVALVVSLPQITYYAAHPGLFMERANVLGIFSNDWLVQQAAAGQTAAAAIAGQFQRALLAFNASLDTSTSYNPGIPLLRFWPALFFAVGIGIAVWRIRQVRYALLLIWLTITLIFAGALLVDAPDSHRLLIAAPAATLLMTTGLFWLVQQFRTVLTSLSAADSPPSERRISRPWQWGALLVILVFVAGDLLFYFGDYRQSHRFGDRNSEVAFEVGRYLDRLEGDWQVYFHGPPAMYVTFPTILFLAEGLEPDQDLFDVSASSQSPPDVLGDTSLAFVYLPERSNEVNVAAQRYPQGSFYTFDGILANPLFYVYEVRR